MIVALLAPHFGNKCDTNEKLVYHCNSMNIVEAINRSFSRRKEHMMISDTGL